MATEVDVSHIVKHEKLSTLLAAALADARRIRDAGDPQYRLDMSHWMLVDQGDPAGAVCSVCLAGSMLVGHVTFDQVQLLDTERQVGYPQSALYPSSFDEKTARYLRAIDSCRMGDVLSALARMNEFRIWSTELIATAFDVKAKVHESQQLGSRWPAFDREPDRWWETMDELVKQLAEAGQ